MLNGFQLNKFALDAAGTPPPIIAGPGELIAIEQQTVLTPPHNQYDFSLNKRRLNFTGLNSYDRITVIDGPAEMIAIEQKVQTIAGGEEIAIQQRVGTRSGLTTEEVIAIEQEVDLRISGVGEIIAIEQKVQNTQTGELIKIEQTIYDPRPPIPDHLHRTGWDVILMVNGNRIPNDQICDMIHIERVENAAALMTVTIIPPRGSINVEFYPGKSVTLDVITLTDGTQRVFTGIVDIPVVDIIRRSITLQCTDSRAEQINKQLSVLGDGVTGSTALEAIGYYSPLIFQTQKDVAGELQLRLGTIPYAFDFDVYGNYNLTPWDAKAIPDFTLSDSSVFYANPSLELAQRGQAVNNITTNFEYRYPRLHHTERLFSWTTTASICNILVLGYTLTAKSLVAASAKGANWPLKGPIGFGPIPASGWYGCGGISGGTIAWSTVSFSGATVPLLDSMGNPVLDSSGNPVMETTTTVTDTGPIFCSSATWTGTFRWAQTITEKYSLLVTAPQSITQYGKVDQTNSYSAQSTFDISTWEKYTAYTTPPAGNIAVGNSYYINEATNRAEFDFAVAVALNKAQTDILRTHRQNRVNIFRTLWPIIDLKHTVKINTAPLVAKGKVFGVYHDMNVGTGEAVTKVVLALSKAVGTTTQSALTPPGPPGDTVVYDSGPVVLGNHFGVDPTTDVAKTWTGMIGNARSTPTSSLTNYPVSFVVDAPSIPDDLRQEKVVFGSASYNSFIPDDQLEVTF